MVESQRILDCKAPAIVIDSQTTIPPPFGRKSTANSETTSSLDLCQRIIHCFSIWASAESYGLHTPPLTLVMFQGQTELFSESEVVGCGGSPH